MAQRSRASSPARGATRSRRRAHAPRVARLLIRERRLGTVADKLRRAIDEAILEARRDHVPHAEVAAEYIKLVGGPDGADEHDRVVGRLRQRTSVAASRCARPADACVLGVATVQPQTVSKEKTKMTDPYLRRRVIEDYGPPPVSGPDINHEEEFDGAQPDHDLDPVDEDDEE